MYIGDCEYYTRKNCAILCKGLGPPWILLHATGLGNNNSSIVHRYIGTTVLVTLRNNLNEENQKKAKKKIV